MKDKIRSEFEQEFPLPNGVTFDGDHYVADPAVMGSFQNATIWSHMFRGWKASAQPARQDGDERDVVLIQHQQWISIKDQMPQIAQEVIVHTEFEGVCAGVLDSYGEWCAPCSDYKLTRVTHWMPLPEKPGEIASAALVIVSSQVGGDGRERFENHPRFKGMDFTRSATHPEFYDSPYANGAWDGWKVSAALAPAAVDPSKHKLMQLILEKCLGGSPHITGTSNWAGDVAQVICDEFTRLNRRAIPAAELEQIAVKIDSLEDASGFACGIGDELRSLLGKEGE